MYVAYPPGPLARPDGGRGTPRPGQRMPDIRVRAGGRAITLYRALRDGRHVLVVPAAGAASLLSHPALRPYWRDLSVVTGDAGGPGHSQRLVVLVRPDGHVAARGRPGRLPAVTDYLSDLFGEQPGQRPALALNTWRGPAYPPA